MPQNLPTLIFLIIIKLFSFVKASMPQKILTQESNTNEPAVTQPTIISLQASQGFHQRKTRPRRSIAYQMEGKKTENSELKFQSSRWTLQENISYMKFLVQNQQWFEEDSRDRKFVKINVLMSLHIKTRSPDQCRSHHQKMMKFHHDMPSIIRHIRQLALEKQKSSVLLHPTRPIQPLLSQVHHKEEESKEVREPFVEKVMLLGTYDEMREIWEVDLDEEWLGVVDGIFGSLQ